MGNSSVCRTAFSTCISLDQTLVLAVEMGKILLYKAISEPAGRNYRQYDAYCWLVCGVYSGI